MGKKDKSDKNADIETKDNPEENMSDRELLVNMSRKLESLQNQMSQVLMIVESQKKKIVELEKEINKQKTANEDLKKHLEDSQDLIDELQQRSRLNNVILTGIKQDKNEDVMKVVDSIGKKLGIMNPLDDVQVAHRVNTTMQGKIKPIVIRMANTKTRDKWTAAFRKSDLWKSKIYVNEHLTKRNQSLLSQAKKFKKEHKYKYVWVKDCKILIRKDESSRIFAIRNEEDLKRFMPGQSPAFTEDYASALSSNFSTPTHT